MKILFLYNPMDKDWTLPPYIEYLIRELNKKHIVHIYDPVNAKLKNLRDNKTINFKIFCNDYNSYFLIKLNIIISLVVFILRFKSKYDVLHILFVKNEYKLIYFLLSKLSKRIITSIFGSDFYHLRSKMERFGLYKVCNKSDLITFTNLTLKYNFLNYYGKHKIGEKVKTARYPNPIVKSIYKCNMSKINAKKKMNICSKTKVIVIGTSANMVEQYINITNILSNCNFTNKNILFVFTLTYADKLTKRKILSRKIRNNLSKFNTKIYLNMLSNKEIKILRIATDIFINLRKTDQFVASMTESILAKSELITGSWLPYNKLEEISIDYFKIDFLQELPNEINKVLLKNKSTREKQLEKNSHKMYKPFSPSKNLKFWLKIYSNL